MFSKWYRLLSAFYRLNKKYNKLRVKYFELTEKERKCGEENDKLKRINANNKMLIQKLTNENKILEQKSRENEKLNQKMNYAISSDETEPYRVLYESMQKSEMFNELMMRFGIEINRGFGDISNIVCFVRMIGNGVTFSNIIYSYFESKKFSIKNEERLVFNQINLFYRNTYDLDYETIVLPVNNIFNKNIMKDNNNRNQLFKYYDEIYAPAIMRNSKDVERMAIVRGHN